MKAAINGLGRIGRMVLRHAVKCPPGNLEIVAVNDLTPVDELAYLMRYDSVHGKAGFPVEYEEGKLRCGSRELAIGQYGFWRKPFHPEGILRGGRDDQRGPVADAVDSSARCGASHRLHV